MKVKFGVAFIVCLSLGLSATKVQNINVDYFDKNKVAELSNKYIGNELEKKIYQLRIGYHAAVAGVGVFEAVYQGIKAHDPEGSIRFLNLLMMRLRARPCRWVRE